MANVVARGFGGSRHNFAVTFGYGGTGVIDVRSIVLKLLFLDIDEILKRLSIVNKFILSQVDFELEHLPVDFYLKKLET